jgi:hypothetical protein
VIPLVAPPVAILPPDIGLIVDRPPPPGFELVEAPPPERFMTPPPEEEVRKPPRPPLARTPPAPARPPRQDRN